MICEVFGTDTYPESWVLDKDDEVGDYREAATVNMAESTAVTVDSLCHVASSTGIKIFPVDAPLS